MNVIDLDNNYNSITDDDPRGNQQTHSHQDYGDIESAAVDNSEQITALLKKQTSELSDKFDTFLNSYSLIADFGEGFSKINIVLDEYEKSVFLTRAENEIFVNFYNGKNIYGDYFEGTEELRRYLDTLVKDDHPQKITEGDKLSDYSELYKLKDDVAFITLEQVTYSDDTTKKCNVDGFKVSVYPVTQDEYARVKDNPFRGPTKYKVLRLDKGNKIVELIKDKKYTIGDYYIRYLKRPEPIILTDLTETGLYIEGKNTLSMTDMNPILLDTILNRAVILAVQSKSLGVANTTTRNKKDE